MNSEEKRELAMVLASGRRASSLAIGDSKPCRVCYLPETVKVVAEGLLGTGLAMKPLSEMINSVMDIVEPGHQNISVKTFDSHRKNHISVRLFMQREVIERRAKAAQKDIVNNDGSIMTPSAYAEIMMNAGAENLIRNPDLVSPMEGLAAAKTLHDFESSDTSNLDIARMAAQLQGIIMAVKAVCSPTQLETITRLINADVKKDEDDIDVA